MSASRAAGDTPAILVGQSGGPTAVINASLAGVVRAGQASSAFGRVLGMRNGVQGALDGNLVELSHLSEERLARLERTPSAALGSCRYRLKPGDEGRLVDLCRREEVGAFIYIGGNDSADTTRRVGEAAAAEGLELMAIGVPKTIDNDLPGTDHCPGYPSAARFVAQTTRETARDTWAMRSTDPIRFVEVMGRHAGWLPAAAWLAKSDAEATDDAPHLVYLPERPVWTEQVVADVQRVYERIGWCVIVLCENQPDPSGGVIGGEGEPRWIDAFGHAYYDSPAQHLSRAVSAALGVRARFDKPGTIQRMATGYVSDVDRVEAELVGRRAVELASRGLSGVMVTLERLADDPYRAGLGTVDLGIVASQQRALPDGYIAPSGSGLTEDFVRYLRPLLGASLPSFELL